MSSEGLTGVRVLVVGAASGIGAAVVGLCRERDAVVVGADLSEAATVDLLGDLTVSDDRSRMVRTAVERMGGLDVLIITAGGGSYTSIANTGEDQWNKALQLNVVGPSQLVREALPHLTASPAASVVTVASAAGLRSYPEFSAYGSAKAALIRWTRGAAWELAEHGIRVNCVSPGPIDTPMLRATQPEGYTSDEWVVEVAKNTALRRAGKPEEVAEAITFLASQRASYLTGVILPADGGEVA